MEKLRFAPIVRVSTEEQEKQGESLKTQKKQIRGYVEMMGGVLPESCWKYSGQEHATPDQERTLLNKLLDDSGKGLFDAVIVCDPSRWSRDNLKSKEGLNILRANSIRFFVGTTEYDLYNPTQNLFLGMSAEIGEFQATEQSRKSILNRIERAKRGIPTTGKLPYGRTWDNVKGWGIDKEKLAIVKDAANRYLSGEGIPDIAASYNMNASNLHKVLTLRCGTEWECSFSNPKVNINEKVMMTIPALLDEKTIAAINERTRKNITYVRGHKKYNYLLAGMIYCKRCGYAMASYRNHNIKLYYRHSHYGGCDFHKMIPAIELENTVLIKLVKTFGDKELIQAAINQATPDLQKIEALTKEKEMLSKEAKKINGQRETLIEKVSNGLFTEKEIKNQIDKIRTTEESINNRLSVIEAELSNIPNPKQIKKASAWVSKVVSNSTKSNPGIIFKRSFEWKRKLVEQAFAGVNHSGKRLGVYVDFINGQFTFEINGLFENTVNSLPLTDDELLDVFNIDLNYQDKTTELKKIKSNMLGKCYAHHIKCIYQRR